MTVRIESRRNPGDQWLVVIADDASGLRVVVDEVAASPREAAQRTLAHMQDIKALLDRKITLLTTAADMLSNNESKR